MPIELKDIIEAINRSTVPDDAKKKAVEVARKRWKKTEPPEPKPDVPRIPKPVIPIIAGLHCEACGMETVMDTSDDLVPCLTCGFVNEKPST